MNFLDDLKTWHWVIIGLLAGLVVGMGLTLNPPRADHVLRPPISFDQFISSVQESTAGDLIIRNITIGPIENGQQLVIGEYLENEKFRPFALYIDVPFTATNIRAASVQEYLHAATQLNHGIAYRLAWWQADWFVFTASGLAGLILVGGVWPQMLHILRGGRPQGDINNYDLNRFHHEPSANPAQPSEDQSAALAQHVENMPQRVPETISIPTPQSTPVAPIVRPLSAGPLSVSTPTPIDEEKKYAGEFYPVEKPHKSKDDAFSLAELVVVMGIITILISILLPAIQRARAVANVTACASNMRQMGIGLQIYLNENKGITFWRGENINTDGMDWYAYGGRETGNANRALNDYFNTPPRPLNHYLHNQLAIFHCPCDIAAPWTYDTTFSNYPAPTQFDWVGTSYNFNANGYPLRDPPRQDQGLDGVPFTSIRNTSQTIVFYEADLYYGYDWHYAHKGNLAFADDHVEFVPLPPQFGQIQWNP